ncbi:MAG: FkbM family methyltransferase [Leptolyngbyaceae cyanobacterium CRU_2_3]|nr:FkbM family methyltransferase [Leptolyngbyaceae cyanobacterium CRU_2_3]
MTNSLIASPADSYRQYLQRFCPTLDLASLSDLCRDIETTQWDEPESALDLNNFAVIALIEAEQSSGILRSMNLELALEALQQGVALQPSHPLCVAHLAILHHLIGENTAAAQTSFSTLLELFQLAFHAVPSIPLGLIYLPSDRPRATSQLHALLQAPNGHTQALLLLSETLWRSQQVFYSVGGLRFLQLAVQLMPQSAELHLKLGLAKLLNHQWEGLLDLQQAHQIAPQNALVLQALYLAYRERQSQDAVFWLHSAQRLAQQNLQMPEWRWTTLPIESLFTYVQTVDDVLLAVDPSLYSIVTSVLIAEGDWFESEMAFWRSQIQPGMTVIDVGANVGVYTVSAAQKVGKTGRVLAVEPFSKCVRCLEETRRINPLNGLTICAGAASDVPGTARLALHSSSELNEVVRDQATPDGIKLNPGNFEEITCFTLDKLAEQENLQRLDWPRRKRPLRAQAADRVPARL